MSTGFDTDDATGRNERSSVTVSALSSVTASPFASHVSAQRIPNPPAFVTMATRLPAGTGWLARSVATSNSCSSVSVRTTPLCRNSASTVESDAASSAPVCDIAARLARGAAATLHRHDRGVLAQPARELGEPPRVPERLQVHQHDVGVRVVVPIAQQVVAGDVRLVPDGDERGQAQAELRRLTHDGDAERAALGKEPDAAHRGPGRGERSVELHLGVGVDDPHAVRTDQAHARGATHVDEFALQRGTVRARFREPGGDHHQPSHALLAAFACHRDHVRRGHGDERHVDVAGNVEHAGIRRDALHDRRLRVDGVHHAGERRIEEVVEESPADRLRVARRTDDRDGRRLEDGADRVRRSDPLAVLVRGERLLGERGRELHVDRPRRRTQVYREAAASEDLDHPMVLRQHVGMERRDAGLTGGVREMRDQDRPEAAALEGVGDADAHLRAGHVAFADVLRAADHLARSRRRRGPAA